MAVMLRYWYRLYHNMTVPERALEVAIAARGERYSVQHPFFKHKLFADFALLDRQLVIEVDGDSHNRPAQIKKDLEHELALRSEGWKVVRVSNEAVNHNPAAALEWALSQTPRTVAQLEDALQRHLANHPELLVEKPKKLLVEKLKKPRKRKAKPAGAGKPAAARRKRS